MSKAAMQKALDVLDLSRDDVNECLNTLMPHAGYYRFDRRIEAFKEQLTSHDAAIEALRTELTKPLTLRADGYSIDKARGKRLVDSNGDFVAYLQEPYDQQAMEPCDICGWKAIIPGEPCLMCEKNAQMLKPAPVPVATVQRMNGVKFGYLETILPVGTKLFTREQL